MHKRLLILFFIIMLVGLTTSVLALAQETVDNSGVDVVNEQIQDKKNKVEELQERVRELQSSIKARRSQAASLQNQIGILDQQIEQTQVESQITSNQIEQTKLEIAKTQAEITQTEQVIASEKSKLALMMQALYKLDQHSMVEVLLLNDSLSDFFNDMEATIKLQQQLDKSIDDLKNKKQELGARTKNLKDKETTLVAYSQKLAEDEARLAQQSAVRAQLLSETKNSEVRFQEQLAAAKAEQVQINADIQTLEKIIRDKLSGQGPEALQKLSGGNMIYPVPFRGITAYFHDPDYPYRYVFEHPALDLRAGQNTPIKAALPGFVARTRDAGYGYSYVMLIHADGLSTVYGHVSKILVQEDEFVNQGDIIALSGGMPGTPGAGRLTTGPHLHFETRLDGIPVNPLNYLPEQ